MAMNLTCKTCKKEFMRSAKCANADKPDVIAETFALVDCVCSGSSEPSADGLALSVNERERYESKKARIALENPSYNRDIAEFYKEKYVQRVVNFEGNPEM